MQKKDKDGRRLELGRGLSCKREVDEAVKLGGGRARAQGAAMTATAETEAEAAGRRGLLAAAQPALGVQWQRGHVGRRLQGPLHQLRWGTPDAGRHGRGVTVRRLLEDVLGTCTLASAAGRKRASTWTTACYPAFFVCRWPKGVSSD